MQAKGEKREIIEHKAIGTDKKKKPKSLRANELICPVELSTVNPSVEFVVCFLKNLEKRENHVLISIQAKLLTPVDKIM